MAHASAAASKEPTPTPHVEQERVGAILRLTMSHPASRNCLSEVMMSGLEEGLADAAADNGVHVVVIAAVGNVYCAGHDLKQLTAHRADADRGRAYFAEIMNRC